MKATRGKLPHEAQETAVRAIDELITLEKRMEDMLAPLNLGGVVTEERRKLADGIQRVRGLVYDEFEALKRQEPPLEEEPGDVLKRTPELHLRVAGGDHRDTQQNVLSLLTQLNTVTRVVNTCAAMLGKLRPGVEDRFREVRERLYKLEEDRRYDWVKDGGALFDAAKADRAEIRAIAERAREHTKSDRESDAKHIRRNMNDIEQLKSEVRAMRGRRIYVEPTAVGAPDPEPAALKLIEREIRHLRDSLEGRMVGDPASPRIRQELQELEGDRSLLIGPSAEPQIDDHRREATVRPR